jgi:hypothetical protein
LYRDSGRESLEHLLKERSRYYPTGLTRVQSLSLAVSLVFSVLQFRGTPWLSGDWGKRSIYITRSYDIAQPYILPTVGLESPERRNTGPNPYLLNLGIILLELSQNRSFEDWLHDRGCEAPKDACEKLFMASEWLLENKTRHVVSPRYADVVEQSLLRLGSPSLGDGTWEAVYKRILQPLKEELATVKGEN